MHGFLGCVEADEDAAARMTRWLAEWIEIEPRKDRLAVERAPFRCLASREPAAVDPVAGEDGGPVLLWWGFIARDQLADEGAEPTSDAELAEALLRLYRRGGPEALVGLNGRYLVAVWDAGERRLDLMNDLLGLMPVFLWQGGAGFAFASNVWAIACHPGFRRAIDPRGLADLLMLSCQQGGRTLHRDVSVLPPGSVTTFQDGKLSSRRIRGLPFSDAHWDRSVEQVADEMHARLERSVERRVQGGPVRLPLSGGFDSRVMLGMLAERRPGDVRAVTQFTYGWYTDDMRYARRMARRAGVRHDVVPLPDEFMAAHRERCVAINGGLYDAHTSRYLSLFYESGGEPIPTVSGHLGGELTGRFLNSAATDEPPEERFRIALAPINECRFPPEEACRLLLEDVVDERLEEAREAFLAFDGPAFQQFAHWDLGFYRRRFISFQLFYMQQFAPVIAPFYDRQFLELMCGAPHAALERQRAYRDMICRHFPALARVPNTNDLPLIVSTRAVLKDFLFTQYRRFVREPLQRRLHLRRWVPHPNVQFGYALSGASRGVLEHIMGSRERIAPYLDVDRVGMAVERQLAGDSSWVNGLLAVSTFATALEMLEDPERALRAAAPPNGEPNG